MHHIVNPTGALSICVAVYPKVWLARENAVDGLGGIVYGEIERYHAVAAYYTGRGEDGGIGWRCGVVIVGVMPLNAIACHQRVCEVVCRIDGGDVIGDTV